jgi:hypothetical protein
MLPIQVQEIVLEILEIIGNIEKKVVVVLVVAVVVIEVEIQEEMIM